MAPNKQDIAAPQNTNYQYVVSSAVALTSTMATEKKPLDKILSVLIGTAEEIAGDGSVCSILLVDKEGLLRNGCSPNLPYDYLQAIDGLKPDAKIGTCAS